MNFKRNVIWILSFSEQPAGWPWQMTMWPLNIWWKTRESWIWPLTMWPKNDIGVRIGVIYFMNQETQQLQNEIKVFICTTKWVCWSLMNSGCAVLLDEGSGRQPPIVISTTRIIMCLSCLHPFLIAGFTKTKCFLKSIGPVTKNILPIQWKNRNSW